MILKLSKYTFMVKEVPYAGTCIYGARRTGKTTELIRRANEKISQGEKVLFISSFYNQFDLKKISMQAPSSQFKIIIGRKLSHFFPSVHDGISMDEIAETNIFIDEADLMEFPIEYFLEPYNPKSLTYTCGVNK